ncbi:MAG: type IX secretion system outer membrane channel protein PorV [Bacteroidetes bacterium]|nr:type IX secretion system outer membrane channel protein PorV [Bacteroidota bacterium]
MSNKNLYLQVLAIIFLVLSPNHIVYSQISTDSLKGRINPINTAVPFLRIAPDARRAGIGDAGVALTPDANSMFWNASRLVDVQKEVGLSVTYTPWLRALQVDDSYLFYLSLFQKIDSFNAIGLSMRYFSLGQVVFTNKINIRCDCIGEFNPNEFAIDAAYARRLSRYFSTGLTFRFIYSNLAAGQQVSGVDIHPGASFSTDISWTYKKPLFITNRKASITLAGNISNIGSKLTYTSSTNKEFIPTNLAFGTALTTDAGKDHKITSYWFQPLM